MKNLLLPTVKLSTLVVLVGLIISPKTFSQVTIGPSPGSIDGSASLHIQSGPYSSGSPYRGLLLPSATTTQRGQIQNPATGLLIFNSTTDQLEVNTGTPVAPVWTPGGAVNAVSSTAWSLTGNTVSTTDFLGTTNNLPLNFKVNNQNAGRIDPVNNNTALGYFALNAGTTGQNNSAFGIFSLYSNTSGTFNTASGFKALFTNDIGILNTAYGAAALQANSSGQSNVALGGNTLSANTTGNFNTAVGAGALQAAQTATANSALGHNALASNTTGYGSVAVGGDALIANKDGYENVGLGASALEKNVSGNRNVGSGNFALLNNTTGSFNTATGILSLQYNNTGSNNTAIGYNAGPSSGSTNLDNATAIGANALVNASNTIVLGDNNITALRCNVQTISTLSDKRIKENVRANVPGLRFITKLTPVTYHINKHKEAKLVGYSSATIEEDKTLHSGFLAQDVEAAANAVGYDFEGVRNEEGGKYYTVGYTLFVMPLVQAVKELHAEVETLKAKLAAYEQLADQVKQLQAQVNRSEQSLTTAVSEK